MPSQIAFLRLNTGSEERTAEHLTAWFPRLARGGMVWIDDYGSLAGVQRAVDRYVQQVTPSPPLQRVDYAARLIVRFDDT
jgi:hypothetical protein